MSDTPLMQQYREVKQRYPDALVLFRVGDFFELFEADAETACAAIGLSMANRDKGPPMAGFPHHALDAHARALVQAGHRVVVCDQVADEAAAPGLMRREVVRVLTPGTLTEDDLLDPLRPNHLAAVWLEGQRVGLAWADLSTGAFHAADVDWSRLPDELGRLTPAECLHVEGAPESFTAALSKAVPGMALTPRPSWVFDSASARAALFQHFGVNTSTGFGFDDQQPCVWAAGAVLLYLREASRASLTHLRRPRPYRPEGHLLLDEVTRRSLELTHTLRENKREGSLLSYLDRTVTGPGARLLQESLLAPLTDRAAIDGRLDAVGELAVAHALRGELRDLLKRAADLHRLSARAGTGRASPRDLAAVARTLRLLPSIHALLAAGETKLLRELDRHLDTCPDLTPALEALEESPAADPRQGGVIRDGHDSRLDELRAVARNGKEWLARFQAEEAVRTGIAGLKIGYTQVFGYYIEITNTHASKVPGHYQRKQTLKNAERYITADLKQHEETVLQAEEQMRQREYDLFVALRERVANEAVRLQRLGDVLARLDVLSALAELAAERGYCRPELTDEPILQIEGGRHPVLDQSLPAGTVVPNDALLGSEHGRLWLITGPNLSGKCLRGDTLVFTDRGLLSLESLMPKDAPVNEFTPISCVVQGREGPARTSHFYNGGWSPTVRIQTRLGFSLEGTPEHRLWVRHADGSEGWKRLADLALGDRVVLERHCDLWGTEVALQLHLSKLHGNTLQYELPSALNRDLAYLLGILIGDGTLTYENSVNFTSKDPWLAQEFQRIIREQFGCPVCIVGERGDYRVCSKQIRMFLAQNGLGYQDALGKEIPGCIKRAPRDLVIAFLRGLFDTDGTADNRMGNVGYSTSSPRLAEEVQLMLLHLDIIASRRLKRTKTNPNYILDINGEDAIRFHEVIGFGLPRKRERASLASSVRRTHKGGIPHLTALLKQVQARVVAKQGKPVTLKHAKSVNSIFYTYIPNGRNISYDKLGELLDYCHASGVACEELEAIHSRADFYDQIVSIAPGEAQVYDLTVPAGHAFVANGFVNHNSTFIRQVALITLLAQMGSYVPARRARIGIADRIFTRVGASDDLSRGQSTFMVEMTEAANILNNATARSLIILDEIGRGTSTYDGVSLAWAITEYLHDRIKCRALFATHYHELARLADRLEGLRNYNALVHEGPDGIVFLRRIAAGSADRSYGIHVARLAGMPQEVLARAEQILSDLEKESPPSASLLCTSAGRAEHVQRPHGDGALSSDEEMPAGEPASGQPAPG